MIYKKSRYNIEIEKIDDYKILMYNIINHQAQVLGVK